jgi:hypothetical protein
MIPAHINRLNIQKSIDFALCSIFIRCVTRIINNSIEHLITEEKDSLILKFFSSSFDRSVDYAVHSHINNIIKSYET